MKPGGINMQPDHHHKPSIWPQWNENKPFALVLLVLGSFLIVYFNARITQVQKESDQVGQPTPYEHTIMVEGNGKVTGIPDIATLTLGVESKAVDVASAQSQNSASITTLLAQIKALGVADADVQTSNYNAYQNMVWNPETQVSEDAGWIVSQTLTVKVRNTSNVALVLDVAGKNGVTNISGPNFTIDDPSNLKDQAREKAIADAEAKAGKLAAELGVTLVRVVGYSEYADTSYPYPMYDSYALMNEKAIGSAVAPGSNDVSLNVSITYKIAD